MGGRTPLMYAAGGRHAQTVSLLIVYQADVNTTNSEGWTPMMCVISSVCGLSADDAHDGASCLMALLRVEADPNAMPYNGVTALLMACASGSVPMVQSLLAYAADAGVASAAGMTPLVLAADSGHVVVVTALLNAAASVDVPDRVGRTALMSASALAHEDVVAVLLDASADPLARTIDGCTALLYAIEFLGDVHLACGVKRSKKARAVSLATMLVAAQADPAAAADDGRTPLQLAEMAGDCNLVTILQSRGADCGNYEPEGVCAAAGA